MYKEQFSSTRTYWVSIAKANCKCLPCEIIRPRWHATQLKLVFLKKVIGLNVYLFRYKPIRYSNSSGTHGIKSDVQFKITELSRTES